jgi:hypothetical protein
MFDDGLIWGQKGSICAFFPHFFTLCQYCVDMVIYDTDMFVPPPGVLQEYDGI